MSTIKDFECKNIDSIERIKMYLESFEETSIRNYVFENFVCGAMERMGPTTLEALWQFLDSEDRLR